MLRGKPHLLSKCLPFHKRKSWEKGWQLISDGTNGPHIYELPMDIYLHLSQALMSICLSKIIVQMIFIILPKEEDTCVFKVILIYYNINSLNFAMNSYPDDSFTVTVPTFVNINSWCLLNLSKILAFPLKKLKSSCSFAVKLNIDLCACNFQTVFRQGRDIKIFILFQVFYTNVS